LDLEHGRTVGSESLCGIVHSGVRGLKEFLFNCRSREVPSAKGSCEHMVHPVGGDCVVDRWCSNNAQRKTEASDRWWTHVTWEGVNYC
jgi:hypothetical protein